MTKTFTAPFAQTPKNATAVATAAAGSITSDAPTNTVLLLTAGTEGALLTKLTAMPRDTATASNLLLFTSADSGTTKRLIGSILMAAHTVEVTTAIPVTNFGYTEEVPIRLAAGEELYVATTVALAGGIVFHAEYTDF